MKKIDLLNNVIEYIENNLDSDLDINEIAKIAYTSRYHFQRMFSVVTGFTITEYIRNRRLTLAAEELASTELKVVDIAVKYGYKSSDAFSKAFRRLHGITPVELKKGGVKFKAFPKLVLQIKINGETELTYKIVEEKAIKVFGVNFVTSTRRDECYKEIPEFCNKIWEDGTHLKINQILGYSEMNLLNGYYYDFKEDGSITYMMGWEVPIEDMAQEFKILDIPACTWVVFEDRGKMPNGLAVGDLWRRIYAEWFPSSGFEQVEGPCIEKHFWEDNKFINYICEIWIPVKRK